MTNLVLYTVKKRKYSSTFKYTNYPQKCILRSKKQHIYWDQDFYSYIEHFIFVLRF